MVPGCHNTTAQRCCPLLPQGWCFGRREQTWHPPVCDNSVLSFILQYETNIILSVTITQTHSKNKLLCIFKSYAFCYSNTECRLGTAINNINATEESSGKSAVASTFLVSHPKWALHYDAVHVALFAEGKCFSAAPLTLCNKKGKILKNFLFFLFFTKNVLAIRKQR